MIRSFAEAIATMEGFYKPGSIAARNNNPGNLRSWGTLPTRDGYAVFPTAAAGWGALEKQVARNIGRGLTLEEFFGGKAGVYAGYAPALDRNDPIRYARFVGKRLGVDISTRLDTLTLQASPPRPRKARGRRSRPSSSTKGAASPSRSLLPPPPRSAS